MGPFFYFKRRVKAVFKNKARHIQRKTHTKLIPGYLFYNAERQVREANEDKVPAAYKQTERENSCHMHVPNNITAMNNLSYCVCDPSNFSPGYILKVNLKELDSGASSFTDTRTNVNPHGKQANRKDRPSAGRRALAVLDSSKACWVGCLSLCLFDRNMFDCV